LYHCGTANAEQLNREFKMSFRKATVAAALAVSMASTPVLAQSAAPLTASARTGATATDSNDLRGGFIIPAIAIIAVILGLIALTGGNGDRPHSP
jgi:sugar phosphate permease